MIQLVIDFSVNHLGSSSYITDANGEVSQHLEYFAFGETFVEEHSNKDQTPYLYNAKELDEETGLYYYGARYYSPEVSVWLSVDEKWEETMTPYQYVNQNPIKFIDPDGKDGILVVFPDYKISTPIGRIGGLGHAGVLLIDNETGLTKYYEYGRYNTSDGTSGLVRSSEVDSKLRLSNVVIDPKTGKPTQASLNKVLGEISKSAGKDGKIEGAYVKGDFSKMNDYASKKMKESNAKYSQYKKDRDPYSLTGNNCGTFASDVLKQDKNVKKDAPWIFNPTPNNISEEYQGKFPSVNYEPKNNSTSGELYNQKQQNNTE